LAAAAEWELQARLSKLFGLQIQQLASRSCRLNHPSGALQGPTSRPYGESVTYYHRFGSWVLLDIPLRQCFGYATRIFCFNRVRRVACQSELTVVSIKSARMFGPDLGSGAYKFYLKCLVFDV
jgi:hypothetical protein